MWIPPQTTENKIESPEHPKQLKRPKTNSNNRKQPKTIKNKFEQPGTTLNQLEGQKEPQTTVRKTKQT